MQIIYKDKNAIAIIKPAGMPSQPDPSGSEDAMTALKRELAAYKEPQEVWLVHRLDRVVGGLTVFARNKKTAATLSAAVASRDMQKEYFAVVDGAVSESGYMRDYIYKDSQTGKAFVTDGARRCAKEAVLEYAPLAEAETERGIKTLVRVKLHTGRFHQIRVQFASRALSLTGDGKYGSRDSRAKLPALFACRLAFSLDGGKSVTDVTALPDVTSYPWSLFDKEKYL